MGTQKKLVMVFAAVWLLHAQTGGVQVTIDTQPAGPYYQVDGQPFNQPTTAVWPVGSAHVLLVNPVVQNGGNGIQYTFRDWEYAAARFPRTRLR